MLHTLKKIWVKRSEKKFVRKLDAILVKRYGRSNFYTSAQLDVTMKKHDFPKKFQFVAYAAFAEPEAFDEHNRSSDNAAYYEYIRELATKESWGAKSYSNSTDHIGISSDSVGDGGSE